MDKAGAKLGPKGTRGAALALTSALRQAVVERADPSGRIEVDRSTLEVMAARATFLVLLEQRVPGRIGFLSNDGTVGPDLHGHIFGTAKLHSFAAPDPYREFVAAQGLNRVDRCALRRITAPRVRLARRPTHHAQHLCVDDEPNLVLQCWEWPLSFCQQHQLKTSHARDALAATAARWRRRQSQY